MAQLDDPSVLISAGAALVGAIIGAAASMWASSMQVKRQFKNAAHERREGQREALQGIKFLIAKSKTHDQCADAARAARRFFLENPQRLRSEASHEEFFEKYLIYYGDRQEPSSLFWNEERMIGFWRDGEDLLKP